MVLTIALGTSLVLTLLLATAVVARAGLRGGRSLLLIGLVAGAVIGPLERILNIEGAYLLSLLEPLIVQFAAIGIARAMVYGLFSAAAIAIAIASFDKTRRRGDVWYLAAGLGAGLGVSTTWLTIADNSVGWPPFQLVIAIANAPFQLCFALIVAAAVLRSRFYATTQGLRPAIIYGMAMGVQAAYQTILATTDTIGHWIAWMQPTLMGLVWLTLIGLFWLTGLFLMISQSTSGHSPHLAPQASQARPLPVVMRPGFWKIAASAVILPAFGLFLLTWWANVDTALGRVMIYTLLAVPLLAGSICLRTALALNATPR